MAAKTTKSPGSGVKVDTRSVLAVLVCLALSAGVYFFFTAPMRQQASDLQTTVADAMSTLNRNSQRISDIRTGKKSGAAEVYAQAQQLDRQMPADVDKIALVANVSSLAARNNVKLGQMDPSATADPASKGNVKTQTFTVSATGSPEALAATLSDLLTYPATVTVSGLTINMTGAGEATANFTLRAFYVPSAALPTPAATS